MKWYKVFNTVDEAKQHVAINSLQLLTIKNTRICLAHTPSGFFAVDNSCPHLGESLHKGKINYLNEIICPWHTYRYNLKSGVECNHRSEHLKRYALKINDSGFFIGLEE